ncbi:MAG: hypothetical protein E2P01_06510 [Acidobacteria bacterium]|nr:MAG: hypothetical protein E2P01_06510 [Acidobacteriota bacterium]
MQIRCASCHAAVWVQTTAGTKNRTIVHCRTCSQEYDLSSALERIDVADLHQDALELAKSSEIDLQAACSVLLRIMSLEEAKDGCEPSLCPSDDIVDTNVSVEFDLAFAEAIKAGHLTPVQAMQRGNRQAFAEGLAVRHRLPLKQALAVADNRMPLLAAIRAKKPTGRINVEPERRWRSAVPFVIAGAAILVIGIFFALTRSPEEAGKAEIRSDSARIGPTTVEVTVNLDGEPTEVSGQDPESVLAAYCESATSGELVPVGLEASNGDWTGLYREDGTLYALRIRRSFDLWVVGDAVEPIEAERGVENYETEGPTAYRPSATRERIVVERNVRGTVLRVSASDPATVLLAYCQLQAQGPGCEPLELRAGIPAEAGLRFGIFRDISERLRGIAIRRHTHGRWIAGGGVGRIEVAPAGESLPGTFVIPVSR